MKNPFKIALIILNYNTANDTIKLSRALLENLDGKYKVFLIDNCSSDYDLLSEYVVKSNGQISKENQLSNLKFDNSRLLLIKSESNGGYSYGNNLGLKLAYKLGFKLAFIINPDVYIPNYNIFDDSISIFSSNKKIGVLGYKVVLPDGKNQGPFKYDLGWDLFFRNVLFPFYSIMKELLWRIEKWKKGYVTIPAVVGCFVAFDLEKMSSVDFYDEKVFLYFEEYVISNRMRQKNYITVYRDYYYVDHNHNYFTDTNTSINKLRGDISRNYYLKSYLSLSQFSIKILKGTEIYYNAIRNNRNFK